MADSPMIQLPAELAPAIKVFMESMKRMGEEIGGSQSATTAEERVHCLRQARIYFQQVRTSLDAVAAGLQGMTELPNDVRTLMRELLDGQETSFAQIAVRLEEEEKIAGVTTGTIGKA